MRGLLDSPNCRLCSISGRQLGFSLLQGEFWPLPVPVSVSRPPVRPLVHGLWEQITAIETVIFEHQKFLLVGSPELGP